MATPVLCCGFECGVSGSGTHWATFGATASFSTAILRSGSRSLRLNQAGASDGFATSLALAASSLWVIRCYIYFTVLPTSSVTLLVATTTGANGPRFNSADGKIYASANGVAGATGVTVTTGQWYRLDIKIDQTSNPTLIDVSVDGVACGQASNSTGTGTSTQITFGTVAARTYDLYFDDIIISQTLADFPIGAGYVNHFVPTSDGTHNVSGANDFERSNTGTDITNATTTAFQLIDDVPLKSGVVSEYINLIAPPNATDYVEVVFGPASGISTPTTAPRAVDAIVAYASATAGTTNNLRIALNDNGSLDDVLNVTAASPGTTAVYARKHYADPPSAASTWTLTGNGNFNNVRMRCFTSDAAPDPWWASAMIEAEFQEIVVIPNKIFQVKQAVNRANSY